MLTEGEAALEARLRLGAPLGHGFMLALYFDSPLGHIMKWDRDCVGFVALCAQPRLINTYLPHHTAALREDQSMCVPCLRIAVEDPELLKRMLPE